MLSQSIRTRFVPRTWFYRLIFAVSCLLFSMLFIFFYSFIFTSIDQIFSQQNTSKLQSIVHTAQVQEENFRNSVKILYLNRSVQRIYARIKTSGADKALFIDLQELLQTWYGKQGNELYSAAMYVDRDGIPLVAIDFAYGATQSNAADLFSTNTTDPAIPSIRRNPATPSIRLDPSVIATWSPDRLHANSSYVVSAADSTDILRTIYPILDRKTKEPNGFLSIDRPLSTLFEWAARKDESLIMVDTNTGHIVFDSSSPENTLLQFSQAYPHIAQAEYSQDENDIPPYAKAILQQKELFVIHNRLADIEWEFFHITPLDKYINGPKSRGRLLVAGALVFLLVTGGAIYTLTRSVQSRSQELEEASAIVSEHNELLAQELQTAHEMQMRLMPQQNPQLEGYEVVGRCRPATEVGGDFFQYFSIDQQKWVFALADVTGHGMQAAIPTMVFSGLLDTEISYSALPETLMPRLNSSLCRMLEPRTFVCLSLGELDCAKNTMRISNGGCPYPYFYKASSKSVSELNLSAFPLGVRPSSTYEVLEVSLEPGDVVVFCSDGIIEASDHSGELFGFDRVAQIIADAGSEYSSAEHIIEHLFGELDAFSAGNEQDDDQTIVVVRAA
mgnify:FL=1